MLVDLAAVRRRALCEAAHRSTSKVIGSFKFVPYALFGQLPLRLITEVVFSSFWLSRLLPKLPRALGNGLIVFHVDLAQ